ncbi:MAG: hypothetical protein ABH812_03925 [bacterium]
MQDADSDTHIKLSRFTKALVENFNVIKRGNTLTEGNKITVSPTVSLFALAYEKFRNILQYQEESVIRRSAIERILIRRLSINPTGKNEAENLIRELLWARYFPNESLNQSDINNVQNVLDKYQLLKKEVIVGRADTKKGFYSSFIFDLMTCDIEETLAPQDSKQSSLFTFYIFQVLKDKLKIESIDENTKNSYFFLAIDKYFNKGDMPYLRYHLFSLYNEKISTLSVEEIRKYSEKFIENVNSVEKLVKSILVERMGRFVKNHIPPFRILFELFKKKGNNIEKVLEDENTLWIEVEKICREKYEYVTNRLNHLAFKAIIYIFLTKMLIAFLAEYPLSLYLYGGINYLALTINTLFPPLLMFILIGLTKTPDEENTKRLFDRIKDIVDADKTFETTMSFITKNAKPRRPALIFGFTIFYTFTFFITFLLIYLSLNFLGFNVISQIIFLLFISLVSYFAYRIRKIAKQYTLRENESIFRPFFDIFFMPILSFGQFLSRGLAKLNFFTAFFDFIIEAPFKLVFEVVEEWISFVRSKRDEIE